MALTKHRRLRVLVLIHQLLPSGSERYAYELCRALNAKRYKVELLVRPNIDEDEYYYSKLKRLGFKAYKHLPFFAQRTDPPLSIAGWLEVHGRNIWKSIKRSYEFSKLWLAVRLKEPGRVRHAYKARLVTRRGWWKFARSPDLGPLIPAGKSNNGASFSTVSTL